VSPLAKAIFRIDDVAGTTTVSANCNVNASAFSFMMYVQACF
jgi:hypothetical protein